jgi:D-sedoheptulose 7-phosphate isomerase
MVLSFYRKGGNLFIAGNGGSVADSKHLAVVLFSSLTKKRHPLAAKALTIDTQY